MRSLQGRAAAAKRWNSPNRDALASELAAARLADHIERVVSDWPPITPEQRDRLALLLRGGTA